ncbi:hypothetical protein SAMN05892883_3940 [Jatrophihabitans sp. GAS493]|uniref:hypothetical protein n=1 Tax=Jatrophihabitans sp. GAS493 TaxID=1907575 RepID=UPI000BB7BA1B|nr:hypothetical protein [Jatrophihabitans sp. GAS493]SOD74749.1 hypothetical protein SAMN05892883_3940 [Jatrophihabitans sp. GAS493]
MLDVAIRRVDGETVIDLGSRAAPPLPVLPALAPLLPNGLRRGSTVSITGSVSLLLAVMGAASADGAWCALVGMPHISAEAASEYGIELSRLAFVPSPGKGWTTAVGALLDAVDVVATRVPNRVADGDIRRLSARVRTREAVLLPFGTTASRPAGQPGAGSSQWPGADLRLTAEGSEWLGIGEGYGRLRQRQLAVTVQGRGQAAQPRTTTLWLPARGGGAEAGSSTPTPLPLPVGVTAAPLPAQAS